MSVEAGDRHHPPAIWDTQDRTDAEHDRCGGRSGPEGQRGRGTGHPETGLSQVLKLQVMAIPCGWAPTLAVFTTMLVEMLTMLTMLEDWLVM
jgi:hypothetical protein